MLDHTCDAIHTSRVGYHGLPVVWCVLTLTPLEFVIDSPKVIFPLATVVLSHILYPVCLRFAALLVLLGQYTDPFVPTDCAQPLAHEVVSGASLDQDSVANFRLVAPFGCWKH
jgi:hypothetical protein